MRTTAVSHVKNCHRIPANVRQDACTLVPKKKRAARSNGKAAPLTRAVADQAAERLHRLAAELDAASKEAEAVADLVSNDLTEALSKHLVDDAKKTR